MASGRARRGERKPGTAKKDRKLARQPLRQVRSIHVGLGPDHVLTAHPYICQNLHWPAIRGDPVRFAFWQAAGQNCQTATAKRVEGAILSYSTVMLYP